MFGCGCLFLLFGDLLVGEIGWESGGEVFGAEDLRLVPLFIDPVGHGVVRDRFGAGLGGLANILLGHLAEAAMGAEAHAATTSAGSILAHINNSFD